MKLLTKLVVTILIVGNSINGCNAMGSKYRTPSKDELDRYDLKVQALRAEGCCTIDEQLSYSQIDQRVDDFIKLCMETGRKPRHYFFINIVNPLLPPVIEQPLEEEPFLFKESSAITQCANELLTIISETEGAEQLDDTAAKKLIDCSSAYSHYYNSNDTYNETALPSILARLLAISDSEAVSNVIEGWALKTLKRYSCDNLFRSTLELLALLIRTGRAQYLQKAERIFNDYSTIENDERGRKRNIRIAVRDGRRSLREALDSARDTSETTES